MENQKLPTDNLQEDEYLYLCDGKACKERDKRCCFTQGFECKHTSNKSHAIHPDNINWICLGGSASHIFIEPEANDV